MANIYTTQPISQLIPIQTISDSDIIPIVDVTNTTQSPMGTTSSMTVEQLVDYISAKLIAKEEK